MTFAFIIFNCKPWNEIKSYGLLNGTTKITHEAKKPFLDYISFNLFIVGAFFCLRSLCLNIDGSNMHFLATMMSNLFWTLKLMILILDTLGQSYIDQIPQNQNHKTYILKDKAGRRPHFLCKWKMTSFFFKWKTTSFFL